MNLAAFLHRSALLHPDLPALARGTRTVSTYRELAHRAAVLGGRMRDALGLERGDRVALVMANSPDYALIKQACWHASLCCVPVNAKLHRKEIAYILAHSGSRLAVATPDKRDAVAGLEDEIAGLDRILVTDSSDWPPLIEGTPMDMAEVAPDDPAWLFYTSGTTGRPKGAILSHRNLISMTMNYFADVDRVSPGDAILHCAPMSHGSGCYALPHVARAAVQVIPESGGFDPAEMLALLPHYPGSMLFMAPTMVVRLLDSPALAEGASGAGTANLKTIVYGGGPMYVADLLRGIDRLGQVFVQIYGQGEAPMTITALTREEHGNTAHPRYRERMGSVGTPRTDVEVRVVGEDGVALPPGEIGEIVLRGDVVMRGYWNDPEATAKSLKDGWLHTGDVGSFDEDGFLTLKDRSKDMIISGGSNIYPREVEEVLLRHPGVAECSVIGRPHPDWGEEVIAFVVRRAGEAGDEANEAALDALCLDNIARFKRPKAYRFVESLPKNAYGKVLKTELRVLVADP